VTIRTTVLDQMRTVAEQKHRELIPLADDVPLLESGLDSLCLAVLVATLDDQLGLDPFGLAEGAEMPVTVGEFIRLYEVAADRRQHSAPM
jgi:hypothetical protein